MKTKLQLLVVLGKDRPGIIAAITKFLFSAKCNLEDVSMTILEGELAMFLVVQMSPAAEKKITTQLSKLSRNLGLTCFLKELPGRHRRGEIHPKNTESYLVTVFGKDQTGIVSKFSGVFSSYGLNITDLNSKILGHGSKSVYALAMEVDIPKKFPLRHLQQKLQSLANRLKVEVRLRPVERIEA